MSARGTTDLFGLFTAALPAGEYGLLMTAEGMRPAGWSFCIEPGETLTMGRVELEVAQQLEPPSPGMWTVPTPRLPGRSRLPSPRRPPARRRTRRHPRPRAGSDHFEGAALLLGAASVARASPDAPLPAAEQADVVRIGLKCRTRTGDSSRYEAAFAQTAVLSPDAAREAVSVNVPSMTGP